MCWRHNCVPYPLMRTNKCFVKNFFFFQLKVQRDFFPSLYWCPLSLPPRRQSQFVLIADGFFFVLCVSLFCLRLKEFLWKRWKKIKSPPSVRSPPIWTNVASWSRVVGILNLVGNNTRLKLVCFDTFIELLDETSAYLWENDIFVLVWMSMRVETHLE